MRVGVISDRRRRQRARRLRGRVLLALLGASAAALLLVFEPAARSAMDRAGAWMQAAFAQDRATLTLPAREIHALQLAVFDSGERASGEAERLQKAGVRCAVWQRERMRIVCDVALTQAELDLATAKGHEAYAIRDTLAEVSLALSGSGAQVAQARALIGLPDALLMRLLAGKEPVGALLEEARAQAARAEGMEHALCAQLAGSLLDWCALTEKTAQETDEDAVRSFAGVMMHMLCRALRDTLMETQASSASTASAQRTPSTAADVMPPA